MTHPFGFSDYLEKRKQQGLYRCRQTLSSPQTTDVVIDGKPYLAFCSNDYLGLANHPHVTAAFIDAANVYGVGSGASHLVVGHSTYHHQLEEALADFVGRERALLFSSGYMANVGTINALVGRGDYVFEDKLNHASLLDGGIISGAKFQRYQHNDVSHLAKRLSSAPETSAKLVVTDTVFSMDGDVAPLKDISQLAKKHQALMMVDDAHGLGVLGQQGRGALNGLHLFSNDVPVLMGTLGKALGTCGAFVAGDDDLIEYLIQTARTYIYTTALPPAVAAATLASLSIVKSETWRQQHLQKLIKQFRDGATQLGLTLINSQTPIQPIMIGDAALAMAISQQLREKNILVTAIRPPTVPMGSARLRVTLSAAHSEQQVEQLLNALSDVILNNELIETE